MWFFFFPLSVFSSVLACTCTIKTQDIIFTDIDSLLILSVLPNPGFSPVKGVLIDRWVACCKKECVACGNYHSLAERCWVNPSLSHISSYIKYVGTTKSFRIPAGGIFISWPGTEPEPVHWQHRVLTTGPLGESGSPLVLIFCDHITLFRREAETIGYMLKPYLFWLCHPRESVGNQYSIMIIFSLMYKFICTGCNVFFPDHFIYIYVFILAPLGLRAACELFSRCAMQAAHFSGFSCCGTRALGARPSAAAADELGSCCPGLRSTGSVVAGALECGLSGCGPRA